MFLVLSLLSLVAAPITTHTTLVPLARPVLRLQHTSAIPPHPPEPFLPAPDHTTTPYPQQQITPPSPSESRPPATPTTRPPFLSREPDITTSPPTTATPYPTPHTLFRSETPAPPKHCHTLPHPHSNNTYFHIPVHVNPIIHAFQTKKKNRTRSTPSRRTHVPQVSPSPSHRIFIAILILLNPPHTSDSPKRANALAHSLNGNTPVTRTMSQSPNRTPNTNPERLKLGSGVGWSEPERWIVPTRWSLGAKERP